MDNVTLLKAMGYRYLTFHGNREVSCPELEGETGYEDVLFREAVPSVKPMPDEDRNVTCLPIHAAEVVAVLDSDAVSYMVAERFFH